MRGSLKEQTIGRTGYYLLQLLRLRREAFVHGWRDFDVSFVTQVFEYDKRSEEQEAISQLRN